MIGGALGPPGTGRRMFAPATAVTLWLLAGAAFADPPSDPRLRVVDYRSTLVLPLTAFVGYHVHFEFAPGEYFVNLGAGDTSSLDVGAEGNHLLLKPKQPNAGTNLTILTNRRVYFVDYRALGRPPRADEVVYSIAFRYADAESPTVATSKDSPSVEMKLGGARAEQNREYWYCGSPSLRPIAAVDDGLQLRLTFAPHAELPAVFVAEPDGEEALVNTHVEDDSIVIHRLTERLVLRRGREVGCVVDRGARQRERRAVSGTIDEGIERAIRGAPR
jgi:type IV secretion system protein VirB9